MGVERVGGNRALLAWRSSLDAGKTWSPPHPILESKDSKVWHDYPAILRHAGSLHPGSA